MADDATREAARLVTTLFCAPLTPAPTAPPGTHAVLPSSDVVELRGWAPEVVEHGVTRSPAPASDRMVRWVLAELTQAASPAHRPHVERLRVGEQPWSWVEAASFYPRGSGLSLACVHLGHGRVREAALAIVEDDDFITWLLVQRTREGAR